jgi:hypothetical protein
MWLTHSRSSTALHNCKGLHIIDVPSLRSETDEERTTADAERILLVQPFRFDDTELDVKASPEIRNEISFWCGTLQNPMFHPLFLEVRLYWWHDPQFLLTELSALFTRYIFSGTTMRSFSAQHSASIFRPCSQYVFRLVLPWSIDWLWRPTALTTKSSRAGAHKFPTVAVEEGSSVPLLLKTQDALLWMLQSISRTF